jgi:hypothetical protein
VHFACISRMISAGMSDITGTTTVVLIVLVMVVVQSAAFT